MYSLLQPILQYQLSPCWQHLEDHSKGAEGFSTFQVKSNFAAPKGEAPLTQAYIIIEPLVVGQKPLQSLRSCLISSMQTCLQSVPLQKAGGSMQEHVTLADTSPAFSSCVKHGEQQH